MVRIPEIRFTVAGKLDRLISNVSDELGVGKSEYIRSLILADLKKCVTKNEKG